MGADQIAATRPALNELLQAAENEEPGSGDLCASFTVSEREGDIWVQVLLGTINAAYPRTDEPLAFLQSASIPALPALAVEHWERDSYATFTHEPCSIYSIAQFIDRLLISLHALDPEDYEIDVEFQRLKA